MKKRKKFLLEKNLPPLKIRLIAASLVTAHFKLSTPPLSTHFPLQIWNRKIRSDVEESQHAHVIFDKSILRLTWNTFCEEHRFLYKLLFFGFIEMTYLVFWLTYSFHSDGVLIVLVGVFFLFRWRAYCFGWRILFIQMTYLLFWLAYSFHTDDILGILVGVIFWLKWRTCYFG